MTENSNMVMPVAPAYGGGYGGGFGGGLGNSGDWWMILILLFAFGGWGMGGFGGGFGGWGGFNGQLSYDFPWLLQGQNGINQNTDSRFDHAATQGAISGLQNSVTAGFGDVALGIAGINQNICQSSAGITQAVSSGFSQAEIANNSRQMANMQQAFAQQTAMNQGFNGLQSQFAQCCCDNKLLGVQTQNIVQNEGNATRFADANNTRDIIDSQNRNSQAILDKLCQLELDNAKAQIDSKNDTIAQLRQEVLFARGQASQDVQTAELRANNATVANQLVSELRSCPIPSMPVYGNQAIFQCQSQGCGCGCGQF